MGCVRLEPQISALAGPEQCFSSSGSPSRSPAIVKGCACLSFRLAPGGVSVVTWRLTAPLVPTLRRRAGQCAARPPYSTTGTSPAVLAGPGGPGGPLLPIAIDDRGRRAACYASDAPRAPLDRWLAMAAAAHRSAAEWEPWNSARSLTSPEPWLGAPMATARS